MYLLWFSRAGLVLRVVMFLKVLKIHSNFGLDQIRLKIDYFGEIALIRRARFGLVDGNRNKLGFVIRGCCVDFEKRIGFRRSTGKEGHC